MAMKLALFALLGLPCFTGAAGVVSKTRGPIQKVTDLLKEMHDQLEQDEKVEQKLYNKYACWCETATEKKAKAIEDAQNKLRELSQLILTLKGEIATLEAEIEELERKLEENAKMQEEATEIRSKQNQEYIAFTAETKQALKALQEAIEVLVEGATKTPGEGAAFLQTQGRQVLKQVVNSLPGSAKVSDKQMAFLSEFLTGESGAKYTPQSMTVQGILKDMYETFAADVEEATMTEATQNRDYENLIAKLIKLANQMKKEKKEKEELKADKEVALADASEEYDVTKEQMEADIELFDQTKEACELKHAEWTKRSDLRTEEIAGIAKAIEYLSDDENRELLDSAIEDGKETFADTMKYDTGADLKGAASFLQVAATEQPAMKAFEALKAKASSVKSLRLAALAARVHEAKAGHFEGVIKAIDDMIQTLTEEEAADVAKRDQCKAEIQESNSTILQLRWEIKCNEAKIEKLTRAIEEKEEEIEKASQEIELTKQFIKDITAVREQENSDFKEAKKTDQEAIDLLVKVRNVLTKYYDNNNVTMGPIQGAVKGLELAQKKQEPVFERSQFEAPAAVFSGKDKRADESKAIVSILQMVIQDLNDEIANDMKAEEQAQLSYEAQKFAAEMYIAKLKAKIVMLQGVIAQLEKEKADETTLMNNNNILLEDEEKYLNGILPDCEWVYKSFYERADRRAAEMNGLTTAKAYLVGYNPNQDTVGYMEDGGANRYNVAPSQRASSLLQLRR
jgi:hypothetical protein